MRRPLLTILGLTGVAVLTGCKTPALPPVDLSQPGWKVTEAPAIWHPNRSGPELTGELLVAVKADGSRFIQFSKQSLPVVAASSGPAGWSVGSPFRRRPFVARGQPTDRVPWFQFNSLPPGEPQSRRWRLTTTSEGMWRIEQAGGGEWVEGIGP